MQLLKKWEDISNMQRSEQENQAFWRGYLLKETSVYEKILSEEKATISGKVADLAKYFGIEEAFFIGFIDGINSSLKRELALEEIEDETEINMEIDFEKLYFNMLKVKADWLYNLEQWENIFSKEKRDEIKKEFVKSTTAVSNKIGRNDNCHCGSGKKYKKCCLGIEKSS